MIKYSKILLFLLSLNLHAQDIEIIQKIIVTDVTKEHTYLSSSTPDKDCYNIIEENYPMEVNAIQKKQNSNYIGVGTSTGRVLMSTQNDPYEKEYRRFINGEEGAKLAKELRNSKLIYPTSNKRIYREKCQTNVDKRQENVKLVYRNHFKINGVSFYKDSDKPLEEVEVSVTYKW